MCPFCHQSFHLDTAGNTWWVVKLFAVRSFSTRIELFVESIFIAIHKAEEAENKGLEVLVLQRLLECWKVR